MSEAKHTPGPWENEHSQYDERVSFDEVRSSWINIIRANNVIIAETSHCSISLEEQEVNANLIAAAPEMLEALEKAKQFIQNGIQYGYINMPDKDCGDSALETPAIIEAAIQKARGLK